MLTPTPDVLNDSPGEMTSLPWIEKLQQNIPHRFSKHPCGPLSGEHRAARWTHKL